jgi:hypothetical protein
MAVTPAAASHKACIASWWPANLSVFMPMYIKPRSHVTNANKRMWFQPCYCGLSPPCAKFAQCNNPTSLYSHLIMPSHRRFPAVTLCPKNSRLLRRDDRTGQKFAYVYFEDEPGGRCAHLSWEKNNYARNHHAAAS